MDASQFPIKPIFTIMRACKSSWNKSECQENPHKTAKHSKMIYTSRDLLGRLRGCKNRLSKSQLLPTIALIQGIENNWCDHNYVWIKYPLYSYFLARKLFELFVWLLWCYSQQKQIQQIKSLKNQLRCHPILFRL